MFSTESQSSRQKHPIQGGGQIHFLPTCRRAWAVFQGMVMVPKGLEVSSTSQSQALRARPGPRWLPCGQAGLCSYWPFKVRRKIRLLGLGKLLHSPFCRQRESLLDDYSCTEWKSKILYFKSNFSYEILICNCFSTSPALYGANKCFQAFMIVSSLYEREKVFPSTPASSVKGG